MLWILQPLEALSRRGKLQEVVFAIGGTGTMSNFGTALIPQFGNKILTKIEDVYELLRTASDPKHGRLPHLKRSLDLKMGMDVLSGKVRKEWFQRHPPRLCEEAFGEMHTILRGDVMMDGVLCYRDNVRLRDSFQGLAERSNDDESGEGLQEVVVT